MIKYKISLKKKSTAHFFLFNLFFKIFSKGLDKICLKNDIKVPSSIQNGGTEFPLQMLGPRLWFKKAPWLCESVSSFLAKGCGNKITSSWLLSSILFVGLTWMTLTVGVVNSWSVFSFLATFSCSFCSISAWKKNKFKIFL